MKRLVSLVCMLGLALSLTAGQASANILYTFSGVTFSDGGTLTGTFTTNDPISALLDFDITTSGGGFGFHYTPGTADSSSSSLPFIIVLNTPPILEHILQVTFNGGLTAVGAPITIGSFDSFEQSLTASRDIVSGKAIVAAAVPEPSTIALAGIGLLGLLSCVRRRRRS